MAGATSVSKRIDSRGRVARWKKHVESVEYSFQPIVGIHTGQCYGYECLLRDVDRAGFDSIAAFFDAACQDRMLSSVEDGLRAKALQKFMRIPHHAAVRLFINVDNRCFDETGGGVKELLGRDDLPWSSLCLEISEQHPLLGRREILPLLARLKRSEARIALDDFGTGFSGLQALFCTEPDVIKIDRFFITDMERDAKKKVFVTTMVNAAHLLGAMVVAEGIETEEEFHACRDVGCDFVQGYFVQPPEPDIAKLRLRYPLIEETIRHDRRRISSDQQLINLRIEPLQPVPVQADLSEVLNAFREHPQRTFFPVVNARLEPQGILRENEVTALVRDQRGHTSDRTIGRSVHELVTKCPIADIHAPAERVMATLAMYPSAEGVLIVNDMKYLGFLSARSLSLIARKKERSAVQDRNPLSQLPGPYAVRRHLSEIAEDVGQTFLLGYFDFDGFRHFNDAHGFREGDRAILLFAEALKRKLLPEGHFLGHPGGDDFMVGYTHANYAAAHVMAVELTRQFRQEMERLYRPQERQTGFVISRDRDGRPRHVPPLRVRAALLYLPALRPAVSLDEITETMGLLRQCARTSSENLASASLRPQSPLARGAPLPSSGGLDRRESSTIAAWLPDHGMRTAYADEGRRTE